VQSISDILKMLWDLREPIQLIISLITLYLIIWFNKIGRIGDREERLRNRLIVGGPALKTRLGVLSVYMVQMKELRGYGYRLKKLLLWKMKGYTEIRMISNILYSSVENQLSKIKETVERELKVNVDFWESTNGRLGMSLKIPSIDPDECSDIWEELEDILKSENR